MLRRDFIRSGLALTLVPAAPALAQEEAVRRTFRLQEIAGLRRFGYPVEVLLENVGKAKNFRLMKQGKPVVAQFRRIERPGLKDAAMLDFNTNLGPLEVEDYEVLFGGDTESGPEPTAGLSVEKTANSFKVGHRSGLTWEIPTDIRGTVHSVGDGKRDYLKPGSAGLTFKTADGTVHRLGEQQRGGRASRFTVEREGPFAVALRNSAEFSLSPKGDLVSNALITFVASKSWIEILWTLDDVGNDVRELSFDLNLKLDGPPVNVDFGASDYVYGQMRTDEHMELATPSPRSGDPRWTIWKGTNGNRSRFAVCPPEDRRPMEGWAHAFDKTRCTAFVVTEFGEKTTDSIRIGGDGKLSFNRKFDQGGAIPRKTVHLWAHVVPTPVQVGAATSPQAILGAPVVVRPRL